MGRERTPLCSGNKIDIYGVQLNSEFHGHVGTCHGFMLHVQHEQYVAGK